VPTLMNDHCLTHICGITNCGKGLKVRTLVAAQGHPGIPLGSE
jgi:hypothetical protein